MTASGTRPCARRSPPLSIPTQKTVTGTVRMKLYKGNCIACRHQVSLFACTSRTFATFGEDEVYNQKDAEGFINLLRPADEDPRHAAKDGEKFE